MNLPWSVIGEVLTRVQLDIDRPWTLGEMAAVAGYETTHFARVFAEAIGVSPARYVRLLRLERAAFDLTEQPERRVLDIALAAGYGSVEAFSRAFRRATGASPNDLRRGTASATHLGRPRPTPGTLPPLSAAPEGLACAPTIALLGPLFGVRAVAPWESAALLRTFEAMAALPLSPPPDTPWVFGGMAQPWGWSGGPLEPELNCLRIVAPPLGALAPPYLPWRLPARWMLVFEYIGTLLGAATAAEWIVEHWIPAAGLRPSYWPVITLIEDPAREPTRIRLHAAASELRVVLGRELSTAG